MSDEAVQQESHCLVILLYQLCRHSDHHPSQQEVMWHLSLLQRAPEWPLMSDVYPHQHLINSALSSWLHPISSEPKYLSVSSFQDEPSSATLRTKVRGHREEGALILNTHKAELFLWWRPTIFGGLWGQETPCWILKATKTGSGGPLLQSLNTSLWLLCFLWGAFWLAVRRGGAPLVL